MNTSDDEIKGQIVAFFEAPTKKSDSADAAIDHAHIYMKTMNKINRRYLESLQETERLLAKIAGTEGHISDRIKAIKLKSDLKSKAS